MSENQACPIATQGGQGRSDAFDGSCGDAAEGLAQLITLSALYAPTHPRIVDVATPILEAVRAAKPGTPFTVSARSAEAGDVTHAKAERLRRDLDALGIASVQFAPETSPTDLIAFGMFLRKQAAGSPAAELRHADLTELPDTIRVVERQFEESSFNAGAHASAAIEGEGGTGAPGQAMAPTEEEDEIVALVCRAVLAMLDARSDAGPGAAAGKQAAREAMHAAAEAVRAWIERQSSDSLRARNAAEILKQAERSLPRMLPGVEWQSVLDVIGNSIDAHLLHRFRTEAWADFDVDVAEATESERFDVSQDELARVISEAIAAQGPVTLAAALDGRERLSNLLRMLGEAAGREATDEIVRRLTMCFLTPLDAPVRSILIDWLRESCHCVTIAELDRRVGLLTKALRSVRRSAVAEVLLDACAAPHSDVAGPLWPHLAYELVTYDEVCGETRKEELTSLVAGVPRTRLRDEAARLVTIVSRGNEPVATSVFLPPRPALYTVYEILIDTPRIAGFAAVVTSSFKRHPPSHPAAGALVALAPTDERARRLVARLLREGDAASPALRALAVEILIHSLRGLPPQRRDAVWVEVAIRALGRLPCDAAAQMVREVLGSNRLLFNSGWPEFARLAAVEAAAVGNMA